MYIIYIIIFFQTIIIYWLLQIIKEIENDKKRYYSDLVEERNFRIKMISDYLRR